MKYSLIYGCKSRAQLNNKRMLFEFTRCLLRNFDPNSMDVMFPDVLSDIKGELTTEIEIVHSHNLPKMPIIILGNRMIGPTFTP